MTTPSTTNSLRRPRIAGVVALSALAVPLLGACGDDEPDAVEGPIDITAIDYAYVDVPEQATAGATITLTNDSDKEVHEIIAIRLPDDEERPVSELVQLPQEEVEPLFAGLETVVVAPPTAEGFPVEGTGALTQPGRYALICLIPTGADPDEYLAAAEAAEGGPPEVAGGPPHIVQGMFAELTVVE